RVMHHEGAAKAGAESHFGLHAQSDLGAGDLAGVAGNEMVDGLIRVEFGDGRHYARGIAGKKNYVARMPGALFRQMIRDVGKRIRGARVLREGVVVQIQMTGDRVEDDVFEHGAELARTSVNLRLGVG